MAHVFTVSGKGATTCTAITTSDSTTYTPMLDALYVGVTGNVTIVDGDGDTVLFTAVPAGMVLPVSCSKVMATGTTASAIVGLRY